MNLPIFKNKNLRDPAPQAFGFLASTRAVFNIIYYIYIYLLIGFLNICINILYLYINIFRLFPRRFSLARTGIEIYGIQMHLNITDGMWNWYFILPPGRPGLARPRYRMYIKFFDQDNVANKFFLPAYPVRNACSTSQM
jgi:hypothetical protein